MTRSTTRRPTPTRRLRRSVRDAARCRRLRATDGRRQPDQVVAHASFVEEILATHPELVAAAARAGALPQLFPADPAATRCPARPRPAVHVPAPERLDGPTKCRTTRADPLMAAQVAVTRRKRGTRGTALGVGGLSRRVLLQDRLWVEEPHGQVLAGLTRLPIPPSTRHVAHAATRSLASLILGAQLPMSAERSASVLS